MFAPSGAADTAFASGGTLTANSGATVYGWAVASGPTQRIVVAGSFGEAIYLLYPAMKDRMREIIDFGGKLVVVDTTGPGSPEPGARRFGLRVRSFGVILHRGAP
jgi:hypothetical protein